MTDAVVEVTADGITCPVDLGEMGDRGQSALEAPASTTQDEDRLKEKR